MSRTRALLVSCAIVVLSAVPIAGATKTWQITLAAGKYDRVNVPVQVRLSLPPEFEDAIIAQVRGPGAEGGLPGQLAPPALLDDAPAVKDAVPRDLHFVVPRLKAGETATFEVKISTDASPAAHSFRWHDTPGEYVELRYDARPVLRYMHKKLDESSQKNRELTYKVYHHLFDPAGTRLVTKGPGGLYTHHRGLFYGFNRVSYEEDKKRPDVWHCTGDAHQSHQAVISSDAGPVLGRHRLKLGWHGPGKELFAEELRELTVYHLPGGHLVAFASRLASRAGAIKLDGDPQHAGFHFRADNEVADKTKGETYFLRPDGQGKPGETRNWDHQGRSAQCVNLPWNTMSFVLGGKRYTALYLDRPGNPKEARYSERDYGRFGSYFEYELRPDKTLDVKYRIWLQEGELKQGDAERLSHDFVEPVQASVRAD
jgi:hypothetical protein